VLWNGVTIAAVGAETAAVQYSFLVTAAAVGTGANGANRLEFRELGAGVDAYGTQLDAVSLHAVTSGDQMSNRLMGDAGDDTLLGDIGNDELFGGAGTDRMIGGAGDDKYWVEDTTDVLVEQSNGGVDWVITTLSSFTLADHFEDLTGTSETGQTLVGNGVYNRIQGGWGNDRIDGGGAGDFLAGGRGDDTFLNVDASDIIFEMADQGIDTIETALAEYSLAGRNHIENLIGTNAAGQSLTGSAIANRLQGAGGNDVLNGNGGADTMAGGAGNDTYIVDSLDDVVEEHAGGGTDEVRTAVGSRSDPSQMYTLAAGVEKLTGTSTAGQGVYLNALNNVVKMGAGADLIVLEQGGNDQVDGGAGDDFFYYGGAFTAEDITVGGDGADTVGLLGTYDLVLGAQSLSGVEKLAVYSSGNAAAPNSYKITTADANVASGGRLTVIGQSLAANESLIFNGQAESNGSFTLRGGSGSDSFTGGLKNDILRGDAGADTLKGGGGNDQFDYYAAADSTAAARDTILDFSAGDRINLGGIDADGNPANGNGKFAFIGSGAFTGAAGQLRVTQAQGGGFLVEADVNGDKAADLVIQVHTLNNHILGAADIFL
jgi:Ca2+-binding RTX toxin-like protein